MTDELIPEPPTGELPEFEGIQPVGVITKVTGAGQRIRRAMHMDERVVIVVEAEIAKVGHDRTDDGVKRVHTLKTLDLFELGGRAGKRLLNHLKERYRQAEEVDPLPFKEAGDEALVADALGKTDASGVAITRDELAELGLADPSNDPVMVVLDDGTRALWPDDWGSKPPARPDAGDTIRPFSGDGPELLVRELVDAESGETLAEWTDADEEAGLLSAERAAEAAEALEQIVPDVGTWTPSRRRGLEVLARCAPGSARIGIGMWDDAEPVVSSAAADWLIGNGFAERQPGSDNHVLITAAGRSADAAMTEVEQRFVLDDGGDETGEEE